MPTDTDTGGGGNPPADPPTDDGPKGLDTGELRTMIREELTDLLRQGGQLPDDEPKPRTDRELEELVGRKVEEAVEILRKNDPPTEPPPPKNDGGESDTDTGTQPTTHEQPSGERTPRAQTGYRSVLERIIWGKQ